MDKITLPLIIFQYIPETAILAALSLVFTGYEVKLKNVLMVAVFGAMIIAVIRSLPLPPGISTIIMLPVLIFLIAFIYRIDIVSAAIASGLGVIIIGMTETTYCFALAKTGVNVKQVVADPNLRLLLPVPEYVFLTVLIIICKRCHLVLLNIREFNDIRRINNYER